jgi:hypothetical protein
MSFYEHVEQRFSLYGYLPLRAYRPLILKRVSDYASEIGIATCRLRFDRSERSAHFEFQNPIFDPVQALIILQCPNAH